MRAGPFECGLRGGLRVTVLALHAGTAAALLASQLPWWALAGLLVCVGVSAWRVVVAGGEVHRDRRGWWWRPSHGRPQGPMRLAPGGYRGARLVVLHLVDGRRRRTCVIQRNGQPASGWRRLAVLLG